MQWLSYSYNVSLFVLLIAVTVILLLRVLIASFCYYGTCLCSPPLQPLPSPIFSFFFFNDTAPPEISPLPLHDALPIFRPVGHVDEPRARLAARHDRLDAHIGGHPAETGVKGLPEPPPGGLAPDLAQVGGGIASFRHVEIGRAHV